MTALSITPHYSRIFYQELLAHFDKALILLNHWWQASQLEMQDSVYVIHRPLFPVTFHLSCYIGVRDLPPALSLCAVLMSWESWQVFPECSYGFACQPLLSTATRPSLKECAQAVSQVFLHCLHELKKKTTNATHFVEKNKKGVITNFSYKIFWIFYYFPL